MRNKKPSERWLRRWHGALIQICGTDDLAVISAAIREANKPRYSELFLERKTGPGVKDWAIQFATKDLNNEAALSEIAMRTPGSRLVKISRETIAYVL